jgi:Spy/CpxP family protein refolding chaperone
MIRLLVGFVLALSAFGQLPSGFYPWWDRPIAKDLNLTEVQTRQIKAAIREYRPKLIEQRAALQKAEVELQYLFDDDKVDSKRANEAIEDLAVARLNLTRTFSQLALRVRQSLTPQQWRELQQRRGELQQQRREQRKQPAPAR